MLKSLFLSVLWQKAFSQIRPLSFYLAVKVAMFSIVVISPLIFGKYLNALISSQSLGLFYRMICLVLGISVLGIILKYIADILNTKLDATLVFLVSQDSIQEYFRGSLDALAKFEAAYMSTRLVSDSRSVVTFFLNNVLEAVMGVIQGVVILILVFRVHVPLFFMVCLLLPICAFVFYLFRKKMAASAAVTKEVAAKYSAANQKQCTNYLFIKLNGFLSISRMFVHNYFSEVLSGFLGYRKMSSALDMSIALMQLGATAFLLVSGGIQVFNGSLSIGMFIAVNSYFATLIALIGTLVLSARMVVETIESLKRMDAVLNQPHELSGLNSIRSFNMITVESLSIAVDGDKKVLQELSCRFEIGKIYCIKGQNGSGKSSFLKALSGGYARYDGQIKFDGINLATINIEQFRREHISYLPQTPVVFFESLNDIYSMGGAISEQTKLDSMLKRLLDVEDTRAFIEQRLQGNGSSVEARFSGGERQKIAFACACARPSTLLLLDEPCAALDDASKKIVAELLAELAATRIIVCVTHDDNLLAKADAILSVDAREVECTKGDHPSCLFVAE